MPEHGIWASRAQHLRTKAEREGDETTRAQLLLFAEDCDERAALERRKATSIRRGREAG